MLVSTARDYIQPDMIEEYKKLIFKLIDETRREVGNKSYMLFADADNAGEFVLIEEWESRESLEKHFKTPHFTLIVPQIQKLQAKPSVVNVYNKVY